MPSLTWLVPVVVLALAVLATVFVMARYYVHVPSGHALIVYTGSGIKVSFSSRLVLPVIQRSELMDISVQRLHIARQGREGLVCRDSLRADGSFDFFVRVNHTEDDVLLVANALGAARASRPEIVQGLFEPKFVEALKTVFHQYNFDELAGRVGEIKDRLLEVIGRDLNGYVLDDLQIEELGQTPVEALDPNNVIDAVGIRAITERTGKPATEKVELGQIREAKDVALAGKLARSSAPPRGASS
jgi:uncharacterized membrane protein YqiK